MESTLTDEPIHVVEEDDDDIEDEDVEDEDENKIEVIVPDDLIGRQWKSAITMVADGGNIEQWVAILYTPAIEDQPALVATSYFKSDPDEYNNTEVSGASDAELAAISELAKNGMVHILRYNGTEALWTTTDNGFLSELSGFAATFDEAAQKWLGDSIPAFECLYAYAELPPTAVLHEQPLGPPFQKGFIRIIIPGADDVDPDWDGIDFISSWAT